MAAESILFASIAMFALSISMLLRMGVLRFRAAKKREVDIAYYKLYRGEVAEPDEVRVMSRHAHNHFEIPPLFHVVVLMTYATATVTPFAVILAWAYVGFRVLHSIIHLRGNNVNLRFLAFIASVLVLIVLWARMLVALL